MRTVRLIPATLVKGKMYTFYALVLNVKPFLWMFKENVSYYINLHTQTQTDLYRTLTSLTRQCFQKLRGTSFQSLKR